MHVAGVAGKGETLDIVPRFLITGRRVQGASFGGVKGREQVPQLVDRYLAGDIDVDSFISHRITLDEVNRGLRTDARPGRDPQRHRIQLRVMDIYRAEHPMYLSNAYLVVNDGKGMFVDGHGEDQELVDRVDSEGIEIQAILLTHHHGDHVQLENYEKFDVPVYASDETDELLGGDVASDRSTTAKRSRSPGSRSSRSPRPAMLAATPRCSSTAPT